MTLLNKLNISDISNEYIINSIPGIFYVYEKIVDRFSLILWNKNHEVVTGYSSKELFNMSPLDFFNEDEHYTIIEGLSEIFQSGKVKQVFGNLKLKNKDTIPFIFEGYQINKNNRSFFIGTGINISSFFEEKKKLKKIKQKLSKKERELFSIILEKEKENILINKTVFNLEKIRNKEKIKEVKEELILLKNTLLHNFNIGENWALFKHQFNNINPKFFKNLYKNHPNLTKNDLKYCAYLKINLSTSQVASILNISKEGIKKRRYRLRKKLDLPKAASLENYIDSL